MNLFSILKPLLHDTMNCVRLLYWRRILQSYRLSSIIYCIGMALKVVLNRMEQ